MAPFSFIINTIAVAIGSLLGLIFKKIIKEEVSKSILKVVGLVTILIGVSGVIENIKEIDYALVVLIVVMAIGTLIGELIKIDQKVDFCCGKIEKKLNKGKIGEGLITSSIIMCVGALTIIGTLTSVLGDASPIYVKSVLDFITSMILASTLGFGVVLSTIVVFVIQGTLTLLFYVLKITIDESLIHFVTQYISMCGYLIVIGVGFNFFLKEKIKVINMLPSLLLVLIYAVIIFYVR